MKEGQKGAIRTSENLFSGVHLLADSFVRLISQKSFMGFRDCFQNPDQNSWITWKTGRYSVIFL